MSDEVKFFNAYWIDNEHTAFDVAVVMDDKIFPFTYLVDGSDDNDSKISLIVQNAYKNNTINIKEYPESLKKLELQKLKRKVRSIRDELLAKTDHLIMPDYSISDSDRESVLAYRQALRNVPQQEGFPNNVVWPEKPECVH